jgi:hypothetical protein
VRLARRGAVDPDPREAPSAKAVAIAATDLTRCATNRLCWFGVRDPYCSIV